MQVLAEIKLYNHALREAKRRLGLTLHELSKRSGVMVNCICWMQRFQFKGHGSPDTWRERAMKLERVLGVPAEVLAPEEMLETTLETISSVKDIEPRNLLGVGAYTQRLTSGDDRATDPAYLAQTHELSDRMVKSLDCLTDREKTVVRWRYGLAGSQPKTQREIANELGVTASRISSIEIQAIRRLQRSGCAKALLAAACPEELP